jgi:hypothetical protein
MAATVTANLSDITLGESADSTDWTGTDGASTEVYRQGSASEGWIVAKNGNETGVFDAYANNGNSTYDLSATDTHLYITIKCDVAPYIDYLRFGLSSATGDGATTTGTNWWTIVDNTTSIEWYGEWRTFVLDVNESGTDADSSGTLDLSAISDVHINVDNSNSGNIRSIENTYIDGIRFGTGLTITGTAWDWADVAAIDQSSSNYYDIIRQVGPGMFLVQGQLKVGNGATTTTLDSTNEVLGFNDVSTAGAAGGRIGYTASGFYKLVFQGSGCAADLSNTSVAASANSGFILDADDTNLGTDAVVWSGGVISYADSVLLYTGQTWTGITWSNCGQIDPGAATFESFVITGYTGTEGGALLWPGGTTVKNGVFRNNLKSIEVTQTTTQTYDGLTFPDEDNTTKQSTHLNNGGTSITINKTSGSNPQYYTATGGGTVTFSASFILTLEDVPSGVQATIVNSSTRTELKNEVSTGVDITYSHGGGEVVDILFMGLDYDPNVSDIFDLTLPNSDRTITLGMIDDPNYSNPT